MRAPDEFHYRFPDRVRGYRPGSHQALSTGAGQEFVSHARLYDRPDPRRLDLRASLRSLDGEWLVRVNRQRAGVSVHAVVDVSESMRFGARTKLQVAGEFLESLGVSAFRTGDAAGMLAFDGDERPDLFVPARVSRGAGSVMAEKLGEAARAGATSRRRRADAPPDGGRGLERTITRLIGREGLVFIVSDFHWPPDCLSRVLELLAPAVVVPMVVWNRAEIEPPVASGFALLADAESGAQRSLWLRPVLRNRWREAVARRRSDLERIFSASSARPFYVSDTFDAEALSRYFIEGAV
jgi:hypothetical protein